MDVNVLPKLRRARQRIAQGWRQHDYYSRGCWCLAGALFGPKPEAQMADMPREWFRALGFESEAELIYWNDRPERAQADVMERLTAAIEKLALP